MNSELSKAWILSAQADLKNISHILKDEFLTHIVAFHAQQCVEKCFKAIISLQSNNVPRVHSTLTLYGMIKDRFDFDLDLDVLSDFNQPGAKR